MTNLEKIKAVAESRIRQGGYGALSFREVAKEVGIKSASVHYHFPTKVDLAVAIADEYATRFMAAIKALPETSSIEEQLHHYIACFRQAVIKDKKMCLCGVLAAEGAGLPEALKESIAVFFRLNKDWLIQLFSREGKAVHEAEVRAAGVLAALEGALLVIQATGDDNDFDKVAVFIKESSVV